MKRKLTLFFVIVLAVVGSAKTAFGQIKGYTTKKYTAARCAHMINVTDMGKVKRIQGLLFVGNDEPLFQGIVAVYKITDGKNVFIKSYVTGDDGRFKFRDLKEGSYLLKTGSIGDGFNCLEVNIMLVPKDKDSSDEDLKIRVQIGT